jgi:hypothetical protein
MSAIAQLVVANPSDAKVLLDSEDPLESWDGFTYTGLDRVRLITLWALAESASPDDQFDERLDAVRVINDKDSDRWVDILPPEMVAALGTITTLDDSEFARLARSWRDTEEFEGWKEDEVFDLLRQVSDLAETAQLENKSLFLWTEP